MSCLRSDANPSRQVRLWFPYPLDEVEQERDGRIAIHEGHPFVMR